jgi:hypothetical protein
MKAKARIEAAADCFLMANALAKMKCAVIRAWGDALEGNGQSVKHLLRHAVAPAYEMAALHPKKAAEAIRIAVELRALSRYTKDKLSEKSRERIRGKLDDLTSRIRDLKGDVKIRCHLPPR